MEDKIHTLLKEAFDSRKTIILCGAGISYNSGIPFVEPLVEYLFTAMGAKVEDIRAYLAAPIPFEYFMELLNHRIGIIPLLKIFDVAFPNNNHQLIARLAKHKLIRIILTTNFDENIEKAFLQEGLLEGQDFYILTDIQLFQGNLPEDKIVIIKLHGTVSQNNQLTLVRGIANKRNLHAMNLFFEYLNQLVDFETLLVVGYSFSDRFDINPSLLRLDLTGKCLYYIEHVRADDWKLVDNFDLSVQLKFRKSSKIVCNVDNLTKKLNNIWFVEMNTIFQASTFKKVIDDWIARIDARPGARNKKLDLAFIFTMHRCLK